MPGRDSDRGMWGGWRQSRNRRLQFVTGYITLATVLLLGTLLAQPQGFPTMPLTWNANPNAPESQSALLNAWWEFAPIYDAEKTHDLPAAYPERILVPSFWNAFPPDLGGDWDAYRNFDWPAKWNEAKAAGYRRTFRLPARPETKVLRIRFDAVLAQADVFLNGTRVLQIEDGFLPYEADVTDSANWGGENVLEVLVRAQTKKDGEYMRPAGSWVGWKLHGIWQDCSLRLEPAVRIADVWVKPSVRNKTLSVSTTVENATDKPRTVALAHRVAGESIHLVADPVSVPGGESVVIETSVPWENPRLWSPDSPALYWLESDLQDGNATGKRIDARRTRFGFKEFWIDGTGFVLNGKPIRFKGDSWHYMGAVQQAPDYARQWFAMDKSIGANAVRLHAMPYPSFYLDIADEMGICIIDESAVYGSGGNLALKDDTFWDFARDHVRRLAHRDRNHPSVCLWSACNEVVWKGGEAVFPKLLSLETAVHEVDPTRPVSFDENNSDLGGGARIYGGHYGNTAIWAENWTKDKPLMVNEFGCLYYSGPEEPSLWGGEACYADFDARTRAGGLDARETILGLRALGAASITPWNFVWYGLDPAFPYEPVTLEPDPTGPGIKTQRIGANSVSINYDLPSGKRLEPRSDKRIQPNAAFEVMREAYAAQAAFVREQDNNFFDNRTLQRHVDVYNDVSHPSHLALEWSFGDLDSGTVDLPMKTYEHRLVDIAIKIPTLSNPASATLRVVLKKKAEGGSVETVHSTSAEYWIVLRQSALGDAGNSRRKVLLIDNTGETAAVLDGLGCAFKRVKATDVTTTAKREGTEDGASETLVVGKGQLGETTLNEFARSLSAAGFFARGGVLVALEDSFAQDVDSPLNPVHRDAVRAWRRSDPEFWNGIPNDECLRFWSQNGDLPWPNGPVAKTLFHKPTQGAFLPLAETADAGEGLEYSPLLWLPMENGGVFVNGFALVDNAETHPAAARILARLLTASPDPPPVRPAALPVSIVAPKDSGLRYVTERIGVSEEEPASAGFLVVDAESPQSVANLDIVDIRKRLAEGGTVILCGVTPQTLDTARALSGLDLLLNPGPWENVAKAPGREMDPALQGISQDDLVWVRRGQSETVCTAAFRMIPGLEPLIVTVETRWAGYAESAEQFKYALMLRRRKAFKGPHTVVGRVRVGKGELILSQLQVGEARKFSDKARRVWSLLLANAGARFDDERSPLLARRSPFVDENGYIRRWLLLGVFGGAAKDEILTRDYVGGESVLHPEEGGKVDGKTWCVYSASNPDVDLRDGFKGQLLENVAGYMAIYIHSPRARDIILDTPDMVDLAVGSDDGIRAWLNGERILSVETVRPWTADQDRVKGVKLRKGWNLLLLKVSQRGWEWKASARFVTSGGFPVGDLTYSLNPGPGGS